MGLMLYGLQIASSNLRTGVNFQAKTENEYDEPEVCSAYDSFEEDYQISGHAPQLQRPAADRQVDEQQREQAKAAAFAAIQKKVPRSLEEQSDDQYLRSVLRHAYQSDQAEERSYLIAKCYRYAGYADLDNDFGRAARRQTVLFGTRCPAAAAGAADRKEPQPAEGMAVAIASGQ